MHAWGLCGAELNPGLLGQKGLSPTPPVFMVPPSPLVGLYHLVLENTTALVYPSHKPPSFPLKTPAKVSFIHFLGNPCYNWLDWFENAWWQLWPHARLLHDCISQGMSHLLRRCDFALLGVHPAIHPARAAWLHPSWSCPWWPEVRLVVLAWRKHEGVLQLFWPPLPLPLHLHLWHWVSGVSF